MPLRESIATKPQSVAGQAMLGVGQDRCKLLSVDVASLVYRLFEMSNRKPPSVGRAVHHDSAMSAACWASGLVQGDIVRDIVEETRRAVEERFIDHQSIEFDWKLTGTECFFLEMAQ